MGNIMSQEDHDLLIELRGDIKSIKECLDGLPAWQRALDESNTRHSEKIQVLRTDFERLQNSNNKFRSWVENTATSLLMMLIGWYYFGGR